MDDRSAGGVERRRCRCADLRSWVAPDPVRVRFLDPGPDGKRVHTDANQVCWDKAELRRTKADYANDQTVDNCRQEPHPRLPSDEHRRQYGEDAREVI